MKKYFAMTALATTAAMMAGGAFAQTAPAEPAAADPGPITANLTLASEYRYRGIAQTNSKPAIQGGFDYAHDSGFYIGNWNSNISWIGDSTSNSGVSAPIEMDFYAGYKKEVAKGLTLDGGLLQYYYPTSGTVNSPAKNPNTTEGYVGGTYEFVTLKYSYSFTNLFGLAESKGSQYIDLSMNYDTGFEGITLNGHVGYQKVAKNSGASYTDWKLGLTKDFGKGLSGSVAYIGTNADVAYYVSPSNKNTGRGTAFVSLTKTF